jgi:hypothetical protein
MRDTARRRDCVALAVWAHSDLPLTTIRAVLGERGDVTQHETEDGDAQLLGAESGKAAAPPAERAPLAMRRVRQRGPRSASRFPRLTAA